MRTACNDTMIKVARKENEKRDQQKVQALRECEQSMKSCKIFCDEGLRTKENNIILSGL
jgi:hypothetical protein